jgi:urease accessory protein
MLADLRLYQLISPSLPVGGFTYSQGLEWAVEAGWVRDKAQMEQWLASILRNSITSLELPVLLRLQQSLQANDEVSFSRWCQYLLASRETSELRKEERQRGSALLRLIPELGIELPPGLAQCLKQTQLAGFALAAQQWQIVPEQACQGYAWSWLENLVTAAIKLVPLGQTQGQQVMLNLAAEIPAAVATAATMKDSAVGSTTPALAIASARHEIQYTRLFRS